ncbi:MAG: L-threonylcarbamoyladenylate synthase [Bacteroidota bacterium]
MLTEVGVDIHKAVELLTKGEVVALPTETVYGLAANALNESAVSKIYQAKNRPSFNPLIIHLAESTPLAEYAQDIPEEAHILAKAFWPGPLTLLLPKRSTVPDLVTAGSAIVAIRIPAHPLIQAVLAHTHFPLAAPSANPSGYISPTSASHVKRQLDGRIPYILDGETSHVGVESTIVGFQDGQVTIYRYGGVSEEEIESILGKKLQTNLHSHSPQSPGMLKSHYAPGLPLHLGEIPQLLKQFAGRRIGVISFKTSYVHEDIAVQYILSPQGELDQAASNLFSMLHKMDQNDVELILAERVPNEGVGKAINDRLTRATAEFKGK